MATITAGGANPFAAAAAQQQSQQTPAAGPRFGLNPLADLQQGAGALGSWLNQHTQLGSFNPGIGTALSFPATALSGLANLALVKAPEAIAGNGQAQHQLWQAGAGILHGLGDTATDIATVGGAAPYTNALEGGVKSLTGYRPTTLRQYATQPGEGLLGGLVNDVANASLVLDGVGAAAKSGDLGAAANAAQLASSSGLKTAVDTGLDAPGIQAAQDGAREASIQESSADIAKRTGQDVDTVQAQLRTRLQMLDRLDTAKSAVQMPLAPWRAIQPLGRAAADAAGTGEALAPEAAPEAAAAEGAAPEPEPATPSVPNVPAAYQSFQARSGEVPSWATSLVSHLPQPVVDFLKWTDDLRQRKEYATITRQSERATAMNAAKLAADPAIAAMKDTAVELVKEHGLSPVDANTLLGQQVNMAITMGPLWDELESMRPQLEATMPGMVDAVEAKAMGTKLTAVPEALQTPEFRKQVTDLAEQYRPLREAASEQLASSKFKGDTGLEHAGTNAVSLTKDQARRLDQAQELIQQAVEAQAKRVEGVELPAAVRDRFSRARANLDAVRGRLNDQRHTEAEQLQNKAIEAEAARAAGLRDIRDVRMQQITQTAARNLSEKRVPATAANAEAADLIKSANDETAAVPSMLPGEQGERIQRARENIAEARARLRASGASMAPAERASAQVDKLEQRLAEAKLPSPADIENFRQKAAKLLDQGVRTAALDRAQAHIDTLERTLTEKLVPSQMAIEAMRNRAESLAEGVADKLEDVSAGRVLDVRWQPMLKAARTLAQAVEQHPELETLVATLPKTFSEALDFAEQNGFDPIYMPEMTSARVRQLLAQTSNLGGQAGKVFESGARRGRTGTLANLDAVDRSMDALVAGLNQATQEERTNMVVDWLDRVVAQDIPRNEAGERIIPNRSWVPYDTVRRGLIGVDTAEGQRAVGESTQMIPRTVANVIDEYRRPMTNPIARSMKAVTDPWRAMVITLSPGFYLKHFIGTIAKAQVNGVSFGDWANAWKAAKAGDLPELASMSPARAELGQPNLIEQPNLATAFQQEGVRGGLRKLGDMTHKAVNVTDQFARAAVVMKELGKGATRDEALQAAADAIGDYMNLSSTERYVVRSVVPFYSFEKSILKIAGSLPFEHPLATSILMHAGEWQQDQAVDSNGQPLPSRYQGVVHIPGLGNVDMSRFSPFRDLGGLTTPDGLVSSLQFGVRAALESGLNIAPPGQKVGVKVNQYGDVVPNVPFVPTLLRSLNTTPQGSLFSGLAGGSTRTPGQAVANFLGAPIVGQNTLDKAGARNVLSQGEASVPMAVQQKATASSVDTQRLQQQLQQQLAANGGLPTAPGNAALGQTPESAAGVPGAASAQQVQDQLAASVAAQKAKAATTRAASGHRSSSHRSSGRAGGGSTARAPRVRTSGSTRTSTSTHVGRVSVGRTPSVKARLRQGFGKAARARKAKGVQIRQSGRGRVHV